MQEQLLEYLLITFTITTAIIASYILFKKFSKKNRQQQYNFKWSYSNQVERVGSNPTYHGNGLENIKKADCKNFAYLCIEQHELNIIKILSDWNLAKLNRLYLRDNNIQSIEQLNTINMTNLQILVLSDNKITTIKSLRRFAAHNLIWLQLQNNPLCETFNWLTEMNLCNLLYLWVQFFENDQPVNDNLRWLAKSQSMILQKFHAKSYKRLVERNFLQVLKRKHLNLDVRVNMN